MMIIFENVINDIDNHVQLSIITGNMNFEYTIRDVEQLYGVVKECTIKYLEEKGRRGD